VSDPDGAPLAPSTSVVQGPQPYQATAAAAAPTPTIGPLFEATPDSLAAPSWRESPVQLLLGPDRQAGAPGPDPGWIAATRGPSAPEPKQGPGRVELAEALLRTGAAAIREVVVADRDGGSIAVSVGGKSYTYSAGVVRPEAVALADLNDDGVPDLIVARSGGQGQDGSVLVFLGRAGGGFDPSPRSFAVGSDPAGITVGDLDGRAWPDHSPVLDLVVANTGSDSVSILLNQGQGQGWTMAPGGSIALPAESRPVGAALVYINPDGTPDLLVCDSGTDTVVALKGLGGGRFDASDSKTFHVGIDPAEVLVGRFDHRPGLDLVTVNSGSNDLTFISGAFGSHPTTTSLTSGGSAPDAAFAVDLGQGGPMSLVVANGGDGRVALLQPTLDGMELAGVISQPGLPAITALAPGEASAAGLDLFAATAGLDAAAILHFDLATISGFLAVPATGSAVSAADAELVAQLTSVGESPLDLVATLWNGGEAAGGRAAREAALNALFYARSEGQGSDEGGTLAATSDGPDPDDSGGPAPRPEVPADPSSWLKLLLGLGGERPGRSDEAVEPLAARDAAEIRGDRPRPPLDGLAARSPTDPDAEAAAGAVDEALRSLWSDGEPAPNPDRPGGDLDPRARPDLKPARETRRDEGRSAEAGSEIAPVVSSALIAARMVLKASPPRPPSFRKSSRPPLRVAAWPSS